MGFQQLRTTSEVNVRLDSKNRFALESYTDILDKSRVQYLPFGQNGGFGLGVVTQRSHVNTNWNATQEQRRWWTNGTQVVLSSLVRHGTVTKVLISAFYSIKSPFIKILLQS